MEKEIIQITNSVRVINVKKACIDDSYFEDISAKRIKIVDANLSDLEIEGAQMGGAYIHNIGMPPTGHPLYNPDARQKPIRFDNCDFNKSIINNCNLSGVAITDCNIKGMKINGILIEDLFRDTRK